MRAALLLAALLILPALPLGGATHLPCDPYPIGRCGAYQREVALFCYVVVDGRYVNATDPRVVAFGAGGVSVEGVGSVATGVPLEGLVTLGYVRLRALEAFGDDPLAGVPRGGLWAEDNGVEGLQPQPFTCGNWVWFSGAADPPQWLGPVQRIPRPPDRMLA